VAIKTPERLAFEADRARMQLDGRIVMKAIMNTLLAELEEIHLEHNERGMIPRVSLDVADISRITDVARTLVGPVSTEIAGELGAGNNASA
jgi:hypothetical protein